MKNNELVLQDELKYYWVSWYQPTEDYRPLSYPPNESILGWWCIGSRIDDGAFTLCALVKAMNADNAKQNIIKEWPEAIEWRFCDQRKTLMLSNRFPLSDWMIERFEQELKSMEKIK